MSRRLKIFLHHSVVLLYFVFPKQAKLYPTVGLQTPGEMVDTNFGQNKFEFKHFEDMLEELRIITKDKIYNFPLPVELGDCPAILNR